MQRFAGSVDGSIQHLTGFKPVITCNTSDRHPKKLLLIYATMVLISTPFHASMFLHCDANTYGGVDVKYPALSEPTGYALNCFKTIGIDLYSISKSN